jgi:hypothetical protein
VLYKHLYHWLFSLGGSVIHLSDISKLHNYMKYETHETLYTLCTRVQVDIFSYLSYYHTLHSSYHIITIGYCKH